MTTALVIGIGQRYRRDDAVGLVVAEAVAALALPGVEVIAHHGDGCDLMARWLGFDAVVVVDATISGAVPGTVRVWNATEPLPSVRFPKTSHLFGLAEAVEMARLLDRLPDRLHVVGVDAADLAPGEGLSPALTAALPHTVQIICNIISAFEKQGARAPVARKP